jgi:hypothetical protein
MTTQPRSYLRADEKRRLRLNTGKGEEKEERKN